VIGLVGGFVAMDIAYCLLSEYAGLLAIDSTCGTPAFMHGKETGLPDRMVDRAVTCA